MYILSIYLYVSFQLDARLLRVLFLSFNKENMRLLHSLSMTLDPITFTP